MGHRFCQTPRLKGSRQLITSLFLGPRVITRLPGVLALHFRTCSNAATPKCDTREKSHDRKDKSKWFIASDVPALTL
ncbi:hypothetical protein Bpfe_026616 [Biomphalaria pfeifferi]|uniref:Uncharacterized protein n=1 Tax=Biomphalaria pfeifferi TaxID=112525 RepID=A0AAD8EYM9_BIOPF|nr:hypothetical protein Bpfe_026616 [Biomphalaria pfeifferi]